MKVKIYVIEYEQNGHRSYHRESLSSRVAYALGRELAKLGRKPTVRRFDLTVAKLEELLKLYESLR